MTKTDVAKRYMMCKEQGLCFVSFKPLNKAVPEYHHDIEMFLEINAEYKAK